ASVSGSEDDGSIGGSVPAASDVDDGHALTYALVPGSVKVDGVSAADATVTVNASGSFSHSTAGDQDLDSGEIRDITFQYTASDGLASSSASGVSIQISGANDAPISGGPASANGSEDDGSIGGTLPAASDVDVEALTYSLVAGSVAVDGVPVAD